MDKKPWTHRSGSSGLTFEQRLWEKIDVRSPEECWNWMAAPTSDNRPLIWKQGKYVYAYRAVYELVNGPIPPKMLVCHTCDNGLCCNPGHLFLGTVQDNTDDMKGKGRERHGILPGETNPNAKLTESKVKLIRKMFQSGYNRTEIARKLNIDVSTVYQIAKRKTWKHIP